MVAVVPRTADHQYAAQGLVDFADFEDAAQRLVLCISAGPAGLSCVRTCAWILFMLCPCVFVVFHGLRFAFVWHASPQSSPFYFDGLTFSFVGRRFVLAHGQQKYF